MASATSFPDKIAALCIQHFLSLPSKSGKPSNPGEWTLMSAIVLEDKAGDLTVISLGTGSKCLGRNELSKDGGLVGDSHAEVLARRAALLYFYGQLKLLAETGESELFFKTEKNKGSLKDGVKFHFFTSHTPCGDASIITKKEDELILEPTKKVAKLEGQADIHRTGAKCVPGGRQDSKLPGLEYHTVLAVRTKPGRGDPTASLSCSDKMSKWCAVGFQGALLSMLIEQPMYLSSVVLPSNCPYSEESLRRAIVSRLPENCSFPDFFQSSVPFPFCKDKGRPCPTSLIWTGAEYLRNKKLEVSVDGRRHGLTKAKALTAAGRLKVSKREFLIIFWEVAEHFSLVLKKEMTYRQLKDSAELFHHRWKTLKTDCFPEWPAKNSECEEFTI